jgi:hypothetical protein
MRRFSILAMILACGACQPLPDATVAATPAAPGSPEAQPAAAQPVCNSYTAPVTVGGQRQQAVVEACQQPDGSWRVTQSTPGLPPQVYDIPAPPPYPTPLGYAYPPGSAYPDLSPYWGWADWGWAGSPWYLGLAPSIVVVQRFNHFHNGFGPRFAHGFGRGFGGGGFGHGFTAVRGGGMSGGRR